MPDDICADLDGSRASALESQGGDRLFGEPRFDVPISSGQIKTGRGVIKLLHANQLMECPRLAGTMGTLLNAIREGVVSNAGIMREQSRWKGANIPDSERERLPLPKRID